MAGNASNYLEDKILEHVLGVNSFTMPSNLYLALFSTNPTETISAGTELSGAGYARIEITFDAASGGSIANDTTEDFPEASDTWEFEYWAIFDASTSGNGLFYGQWNEPKTVLAGQQFRVRPGDIVLGAD